MSEAKVKDLKGKSVMLLSLVMSKTLNFILKEKWSYLKIEESDMIGLSEDELCCRVMN